MIHGEAGRVILVHGLWMNAVVMLPLARRLRRCGHVVTLFSYPSVKNGLAENARRLASFCAQWQDQEICLVGHSLGGIVILSALQVHPQLRVRRVVLLGVPLGGILSARQMARFRTGRAMVGQSIRDCLTGSSPPSIPAGLEVGVIAGNVPIGLGRLMGRLPGVNDGVVCESETRIPSARESLTLPVSHTGMLVSSVVAAATCRFLKEGRFAHD
ncbi:MAG: esterase/lipase family protein [Burkholderiales bacterium]